MVGAAIGRYYIRGSGESKRTVLRSIAALPFAFAAWWLLGRVGASDLVRAIGTGVLVFVMGLLADQRSPSDDSA